jgi:predicted transposase YbfD/YdcC
MLGGVAAGLGYYFGIDAVWIRLHILLVLLDLEQELLFTSFMGSYTEAKTTSEKLEMTGEPVNISNIEKKSKREYENVSQKFKMELRQIR